MTTPTTELPDLAPIVPVPIAIIEEMAPFLDVSASLLYQIIRKNHTPGPASKRRILNETGLADQLWDLPPHEISRKLYNWYRDHLGATAAPTAGKLTDEKSKKAHTGELIDDLL